MRISDWSSDVCSSDLAARRLGQSQQPLDGHRHRVRPGARSARRERAPGHRPPLSPAARRAPQPRAGGDCGLGGEGRSEEHTSELQSLMRISYAVFCLKKTKNPTSYNVSQHITAALVTTVLYTHQ